MFRTVLVDLGIENATLGENLHQCHFLSTTSHMDCRWIESALLCTFQAESSVTAPRSLCVVELRSIRGGAGVPVVFLVLPRKVWTTRRSEATTAASHVLSAALLSSDAVHYAVPV